MRLIDADALDYELGRSDRDIYVRECLQDAPTVQIEPHWIPVTEGLPKEGGDVLYCDIDEYIYMGHRYANTWWSDCEKVKNVTAWMPLPEPYKEVTE